jgi:hypothetical protein
LTKFYRPAKRAKAAFESVPRGVGSVGEKMPNKPPKLRKITKKTFRGIAFSKVMWYNIPTPKNNTRLEFLP